jgi:hypothetical protein
MTGKNWLLFFARNTHSVDFTGKRWIGHEEIQTESETLFAPYAKKNVIFLLEGTHFGPAESVVASILWENVTFGGEPTFYAPHDGRPCTGKRRLGHFLVTSDSGRR